MTRLELLTFVVSLPFVFWLSVYAGLFFMHLHWGRPIPWTRTD